ncbi:MAG: DMT family transporter, partial [Pseudomonadota bacterium]
IRPRFTKPALGLHTARTCCGYGGVTLLFTAAIMIPLSDATAISFLSPVVTMVLAVLFLGERVGPWRWVAAAISIGGAAILLRPGAGVVEVGALAALGAALVMGLELTLIKRLAGREKPTQILVINNAIGTVLSSLVLIVVYSPPTAAQWAALAGLGGLMACAQACYIFAMRAADASYVAPLAYSTLIFAAVYDVLAFGVALDAVSIIGAATILCGACLLAWRESRAQRRLRTGR